MPLREQLTADLKDAMRAKNTEKRDVIRSIQAAIKEEEQRRYEEFTKKALKKHNVTAPSPSDEQGMAAYSDAVDAAVAEENVEERAKITEDAEVLAIIQKMVKMRRDSIKEAEEVGREDIVEGERAELEILLEFMPRQLTREEIAQEAKAVIDETGAEGPRDMGKVMGPLTQKLKGRADGKVISEVVRELLN